MPLLRTIVCLTMLLLLPGLCGCGPSRSITCPICGERANLTRIDERVPCYRCEAGHSIVLSRDTGAVYYAH